MNTHTYTYINMCAHTFYHTCTYALRHMHESAYTQCTHIFTQMPHTHTPHTYICHYAHTHTHTHTHTHHTRTYAIMRTHTHTHTHTYTHTHTHTRAHTHTHTHTCTPQSYPPPPRRSPESSVEVVESVPQLPPILVPQPGGDTPQREAAVTTGQDLQHQVCTEMCQCVVRHSCQLVLSTRHLVHVGR